MISDIFTTVKYGGKALSFDGTNDYVDVSRMIQDDFTIEFWVKTNVDSLTGSQAYEGNGLVWSDAYNVANDFVVAILNNKLAFFTGNPDVTVQSTSSIRTGGWVYVAVTRVKSTGEKKVFVNGVLEATQTGGTASLNANSRIHIGGNTLNGRYFNGTIDELRIYNRALSPDEIKELYPVTITNLSMIGREYHPVLSGGDPVESAYVGETLQTQATVYNPSGVQLKSVAVVSGQANLGSPTAYGTNSITHNFGTLPEVGIYTLNDSVYLNSSGAFLDSASTNFCGRFRQQADVDAWFYNAEVTCHDGLFASTSLHPFSKEIIDFTLASNYISNDWDCILNDWKQKTNPVPGLSNRWSAAEQLAYLTGDYIHYEADNADHWDDFTILNLNGLNTANHPAGTCIDKAAAYVSCARSIGLPARLAGGHGHAWTEVYCDGRWIHADPTFDVWDETDRYIRDNWRDLELDYEDSQGVQRVDTLTTVKYAVGTIVGHPGAPVVVPLTNGNGSATLTLANRAKSDSKYAVTGFSLTVEDTGGISQVQVSNLPQTLAPGESHDATLSVWGAVPREDPYKITLKLSYTAGDGTFCEKLSNVYVKMTG